MTKITPQKSYFVIGALLIIAINIALYCNTFTSAFVFDDLHTIVDTEGGEGFRTHLKDITNYSAIFNLHPSRFITYFSIALNYHLGKINPFGYHLLNIIFHVLTAQVIFFLIYILLGFHHVRSAAIPLLCAVLFSLLPIHTETITYIISRSVGIGSFFFLLALYYFLMACASSSFSVKPIFYFLLTLFLFPLSILSKETGVVFPAVVILIDCLFLRKTPLKYRLVCFYLPIFFCLIAGGIYYYDFAKMLITHTLELRSISENLIIQCNIFPFIFKTLCFPINLNIDYDFASVPSSFGPRVAFCSFLFCLLLFVAVKVRSSIISLSILWIIITLLPTNSILPRTVPLSDHNLYLSSLGICLLIAFSIHRFRGKWLFVRLSLLLFLATSLLLSSLTILRNQFYLSAETLWADSAKKSPNKVKPHINLGNMLSAQGKFEEAIKHYSTALSLEYSQPEAHNNLGAALMQLERVDEAIISFTNATRINPKFGKAFKNLGAAYSEKELFEQAVASFKKAVQANTKYAEAHNGLGNALGNLKRFNEAANHYARAIKLNPNYDKAHYNFGTLLSKQGKFDEAIVHFSETLRINPNHSLAHVNLGIVYQQKNNLGKALEHFHLALKINPDNETAHNNIAVLFMKKKHLNQAINHLNKALEIDPSYAEAYFNMGTIFLQQDKYELAIPNLMNAIRAKPKYAGAYFNMGVILRNQGKLEKAMRFFNEATRLDPGLQEILDEIQIRDMQGKQR